FITFVMYCSSSVIFFFSSRRRHTRFSRDWSSDVCSSDLAPNSCKLAEESSGRLAQHERLGVMTQPLEGAAESEDCVVLEWNGRRSEERRVGKECRSRWWA